MTPKYTGIKILINLRSKILNLLSTDLLLRLLNLFFWRLRWYLNLHMYFHAMTKVSPHKLNVWPCLISFVLGRPTFKVLTVEDTAKATNTIVNILMQHILPAKVSVLVSVYFCDRYFNSCSSREYCNYFCSVCVMSLVRNVKRETDIMECTTNHFILFFYDILTAHVSYKTFLQQ